MVRLVETIPRTPPVQLPCSDQLSFEPKLVGFDRGVLDNRTVGPWQIEVIEAEHPLPKRARARLEEFLATGVEIRQIALYHELPQSPPLWLVAARHLPQILKYTGIALASLAAVALVAAGVVGLIWLAAQLITPIVVGLVGTLVVTSVVSGVDPVLVVQTRSGIWLELDRWVE